MILPNGVTEASMRAALTEFSAIVGNEWFFGPLKRWKHAV